MPDVMADDTGVDGVAGPGASLIVTCCAGFNGGDAAGNSLSGEGAGVPPPKNGKTDFDLSLDAQPVTNKQLKTTILGRKIRAPEFLQSSVVQEGAAFNMVFAPLSR
jgi:hypothetical protein